MAQSTKVTTYTATTVNEVTKWLNKLITKPTQTNKFKSK